jgi:4a-hydroxytetrahydrobiopterin dehydratase
VAKLTGAQVAAENLTGWAMLLNRLATRVPFAFYADGLALVAAIGAAAEELDHHPALDLRYSYLDISLTSYDTGGVTARDLRLARVISGLVADAGLDQETTSVALIELGLDTPSEGPAAFWAAVLGSTVHHGEVYDKNGSHPTVWFQKSGTEEPRQRWHPDIWLDPAQVKPRIDAAVAAGGTLVSAEAAPSFWVLADPEGNKVCLCTWQERE